MKVSVLIPVYNYDCTQLVSDLSRQLLPGDEIIVGDDGSTDSELWKKNQTIGEWKNCCFWRSEVNMGRSRIRNRLAEMAEGEWVIFIDCDAKVNDINFLENYRKAMTGKYSVVCGGTGNLEQCPKPEVSLRWKYEIKAEQRLTLEFRQQNPYAQFTTFNFAIKRDVFLGIKFAETITDYGHEDTKFGVDLQQKDIPLLHIENKLIHLGLESNVVFLHKTETSLQQLHKLPAVCEHARIAITANKLKRWHMRWLASLIYRVLKNWFRKNLCGTNPRLFIFNLYKLGYFINL